MNGALGMIDGMSFEATFLVLAAFLLVVAIGIFVVVDLFDSLIAFLRRRSR
jgi:hypothetical protein